MGSNLLFNKSELTEGYDENIENMNYPLSISLYLGLYNLIYTS